MPSLEGPTLSQPFPLLSPPARPLTPKALRNVPSGDTPRGHSHNPQRQWQVLCPCSGIVEPPIKVSLSGLTLPMQLSLSKHWPCLSSLLKCATLQEFLKLAGVAVDLLLCCIDPKKDGNFYFQPPDFRRFAAPLPLSKHPSHILFWLKWIDVCPCDTF